MSASNPKSLSFSGEDGSMLKLGQHALCRVRPSQTVRPARSCDDGQVVNASNMERFPYGIMSSDICLRVPLGHGAATKL